MAAAHDDVAAAVDIHAVIVPVALVLDAQALDQQVVAVEIVLHPARRILHEQAADMHVAAIDDAQQERSARRAVDRLVAVEASAAPVDRPVAADGDVAQALGEDQRLVHAHIGVLHRAPPGDAFGPVRKIQAAQKARAACDVELHAAAHIERAADVIALRQPRHAAARLRRRVDGGLNRLGGQGRARHVAISLRRKDALRPGPRLERGGQPPGHRLQIAPQRIDPAGQTIGRRMGCGGGGEGGEAGAEGAS